MVKRRAAIHHRKIRQETPGLPGLFSRDIRITVLGAGSMFTPRLENDILRTPGICGGVIGLVDIDRPRLATMEKLIRTLVSFLGVDGWSVKASADRRDILPGTDYLVNCIEVSGIDCVHWDNDLPAQYGIDQCIGDTIGPGGVFKGLRTIPVWLEILKDAAHLCPGALVLNYTNPMSMMCLAAGRAGGMDVVGLCHSVQGTSRLLARRAGVQYEEMEWECAGINHLAWFTTLKHHGKDLYPLLKAKARRDLAGRPDDAADAQDLVRKDVMVQFGAFVTESSGHLSEYLPYYRKRADLRERYCRDGYDGGSGFYAREWPGWRADADRERREMLAGKRSMAWERSFEYASWIIESREKDVPGRIYGNVMNGIGGYGALIPNLPTDGCVEVACLVDRRGVHPSRVGPLPPQMAALCNANMRVFDLAVMAAMERSKEAAIHALMLDPLTAAVCSPGEIRAMTLEMFKAEHEFLKGYR
jgi:alpha-galactosidase